MKLGKVLIICLVLFCLSAMTVSAADYGLTSSSGIWTATSGGSGITGINTLEVRWGTPAETYKSGLRFDGQGAQAFNEGDTFLIGQLTHYNYPINGGTAATGATLNVKLAFSTPIVSPDPDFTYNFAIEETPNQAGQCPAWQVSGTPCDDRITFPSSFGEESYQIGDKLYTLKILGFVNTYPGGSPVSYFITEEKKDNKAYLVGTLSSVLIAAPQITLVSKTTNGEVAETATGPHILVGNSVAWTYDVQNTGNVALTDIAVTDDQGVVVTCPQSSLNPGENMICTASGTAVFGQYENTAKASGKHNGNTYESNEKLGHYLGIYCESGDCCENYNFKVKDTVCRGLAGDCDVAEKCSGTSADCPADTFVAAAVECRPSAGACDVAESCTGTGPACPTDAKATTECRASAGVCDVAENCDGTHNDCPADSFLPSTTECRASAGVCDVAEFCTGLGAGCPANDFQPSTTVCRASAGVCDIADTCSGLDYECPGDIKSTSICRASTGVCDVAESCDGVNNNCPADAYKPQGTSCSDGLFCNGDEVCDGQGVCTPGSAADCTIHNLPAIATCTNTPDGNTFTWDTAAGFTSVCSPATDSCTSSTYSYTHTCDVSQCGAQCDATHACADTACGTDGCVGKDYYDYTDKANTCLADGCACTENICDAPAISYNDPACTECQTDANCVSLDKDYCDGTAIKHDEGKCVNYECTKVTTTAKDCDDKSWCNGDETCTEPVGAAPTCVAGTIRTCSDDLFCTVNEICDENNDKCIYADRDCSGNNIAGVDTCTYNPDNNPLTWDHGDSFTSQCDETNNECTSGSQKITHTCDVANCNAECKVGDTASCTTADGYSGTKTCDNTCNWGDCLTGEHCGDGIVNDGEQCDGTAGVGEHQTCNANCQLETLPYCGDGNVDAGEACDGNAPTQCTDANGYAGTKACTGACTWGECITTESCGDGVLNDGEQCDAGSNNGIACNPLCEQQCNYCGNDCTTKTNTGGTCQSFCDLHPTDPQCGGNPGVPEFPLFTMGLAVIGVGLGLALLRKK